MLNWCAIAVLATPLAAQSVVFDYPVNIHTGGASTMPLFECNQCIEISDFNSDGHLDIVFSYPRSNFPTYGILLGDGRGGFREGPFPYGDSTAFRLVKGQFLVENKPSIAFRNRIVSTSPQGDPVVTTATISECVSILFAADFNGDGKSDAICEDRIHINEGDGKFRLASEFTGVPLLVSDFNNDRVPDLLLRLQSGELVLRPGRADGTLEDSKSLPLEPDQKWANPVVADWNGDGANDLAIAASDGRSILVLRGNRDRTFGTPLRIPHFGGRVHAAADFNRDGRLDLLLDNAVLPGNGDGTFLPGRYFAPTVDVCGEATANAYRCNAGNPYNAVADFNEDGVPDVVSVIWVHALTSRTRAMFTLLLNRPAKGGLAINGVSAATGSAPVSPGAIATAYGTELAPTTETAPLGQSPTTLGGIRLHFRDRSQTQSVLAPLLYVSPTQINYIVPQAAGTTSRVNIERVGTPRSDTAMSVLIEPAAPGIFTRDNGLAAGAEEFFDVAGPTPFLTLYGTGFTNASAANTACDIAGQRIVPIYAGPQTQFAGLDQINLRLPLALAGKGLAQVSCTTAQAGRTFTTNPAQIILR